MLHLRAVSCRLLLAALVYSIRFSVGIIDLLNRSIDKQQEVEDENDASSQEAVVAYRAHSRDAEGGGRGDKGTNGCAPVPCIPFGSRNLY